MVMNTNGKSGPLTIGPAAVDVPLRADLGMRHLDARVHDDDADDEQADRADLQVAREVVARAEQHPHRQHAGDETVRRHGEGERRLATA